MRDLEFFPLPFYTHLNAPVGALRIPRFNEAIKLHVLICPLQFGTVVKKPSTVGSWDCH